MFLRWLLNALALILISYLVPGFHVDSFYAALIAALVLGLINAIIRPIVLFFTLPLNFLTLGLFTFVVNAVIILIASSIVKGFTVVGLLPAFEAAVILWVVSVIGNMMTRPTSSSKID